MTAMVMMMVVQTLGSLADPSVVRSYAAKFEEHQRAFPEYVFFTNAFLTQGLRGSWRFPPQLDGSQLSTPTPHTECICECMCRGGAV